MAVEQLLDSLPPNISTWVREWKPNKVSGAGEHAKTTFKHEALKNSRRGNQGWTRTTHGLDSQSGEPLRNRIEDGPPDYRGRERRQQRETTGTEQQKL